MKLTESQLIEMIRESTMKVINEIGYHEKQKREVSDKEHAEWVKKKSEAKKRELERQRKENGDDKSDSKAIDYHDYKHGKGNFPVMNKESKVRLSASEFQKFITESVKRTINRMLTEHETWELYGSPENEPIEDFLDNYPRDIKGLDEMDETTFNHGLQDWQDFREAGLYDTVKLASQDCCSPEHFKSVYPKYYEIAVNYGWIPRLYPEDKE